MWFHDDGPDDIYSTYHIPKSCKNLLSCKEGDELAI